MKINSLVMRCYGEDPSDIPWKQKSETGNGFADEWRQRSGDKSVTTIDSRSILTKPAASNYLATLYACSLKPSASEDKV
jgi:hypothetical protein